MMMITVIIMMMATTTVTVTVNEIFLKDESRRTILTSLEKPSEHPIETSMTLFSNMPLT
jgi:hypothetical protein